MKTSILCQQKVCQLKELAGHEFMNGNWAYYGKKKKKACQMKELADWIDTIHIMEKQQSLYKSRALAEQYTH